MSADPAKLRLFVAAEVPRDQLEQLGRAVAPLQQSYKDARWTNPDGRHITLKFLGYLPAAQLDEVDRIVARAASGSAGGRVALSGLGAFPAPRRARVLWAGIRDDEGRLAGAAAALDEGFAPLGIEPEKREFTPHLTLARFKVPRAVAELPDLPEFPPFDFDRLCLYRSHLAPSGARYELLSTHPTASGE